MRATQTGGPGDDRLVGTGGKDRLEGGAGDDRLIGKAGRDVLDGGSGDDFLKAGSGNDRLIAGSGHDIVNGGRGYDILELVGREVDWSSEDDGNGWTLWTNASTGATVRAKRIEEVRFEDYAPELDGGQLSARENGDPVTLDLRDLASDGDGLDGLSFRVSAQPDEGNARIEDGQLVFDPGRDFQDLAEGEIRYVTVEVTVTDPSGQTDTNAVRVAVRGQNDRPSAESIHMEAQEDGGIVRHDLSRSFDDRDSDDDGESLRYWVTRDPDEGRAWIAQDGHTLRFDPRGDFQNLAEGETREVTFRVNAADQHGSRSFSEVTVTVTGENDRPVGEAIDLDAEEDGRVVNFDLDDAFYDIDSDDSGRSLRYWITDDPDEGRAWISRDGRTLKFNPKDDFQDLAEGETREVTFRVRAEDSHGARTSTEVTVTVTGRNDAPTLRAGAIEVEEDQNKVELDLSALGSDVDSDDNGASLTYTVTGDPAEGVAEIDGATLTFRPDGDFEDLAVGETREVVIEVTATDRHGASATNEVTVTVTGENDAPTLDAGTLDAVEDGPEVTLDLTTLGRDVDSDDSRSSLTYTISGDPSEGSAEIDGTDLNFDPGDDFQDLAVGETRDVTVEVTATDRHGASVTNDVTVTVTGRNDDPTLAAGTLDAVEDGPEVTLDLTTLGRDVDSDDNRNTLTYTITGDPSEGTAEIDGTELTFDPGDDFADLGVGETRDVTIEVTVTDRHGASVTNDVTVTVTGIEQNVAPVARNETLTLTEDALGSINILDNDTDANNDTLSVRTLDTLLFANFVSGSINFFSLPGSPAFGYRLEDDGEFTFTGTPSLETLALGDTISHEFDYEISDGNGGTDTATVTIEIQGRNDDPTLAAGTLAAMEDGSEVTLDLSTLGDDIDTDDDGNSLTYTISGDPSEGTAEIDGTELSFDPGSDFQDLAAGETRDVTIEVTATDRHGASVTNDVVVTLTGVNDDPTIIGGTSAGSVREDGVQTDSGTFIASDIDQNDTLTWSVQGGATGDFGTLTVDQNGDWTYTLDNDNADVQALDDGETLTDSFTIEVDDGNGGTDTETFDIIINGEDEPLQRVVLEFDAAVSPNAFLPETFGGFIWTSPNGNAVSGGTVFSLGVQVRTSGPSVPPLAPGVIDGPGDTYIFNSGGAQPISITREGGGDFIFRSVDIAVDNIGGRTNAEMVVAGYSNGVFRGSVRHDLLEDGPSISFQGNFDVVDEIRIFNDNGNINFAMDDFVFDLV